MKLLNFFLITIIFTITSNCALAADKKNCLVTRTIFEIGSGSTKAKKAKVDICKDSVVETVSQASRVMTLQEHIDKSPDRATLSTEAIDELVAIVSAIENELKVDCQKEQCAAVGTAALREAANAKTLINILKSRKNIPTFVIPQEDEGSLGYLSTLANLKDKNVTATDLIVLDLGGGSGQLVYHTKNLTKTISAKMGSQVFKGMVIEYVKDYSLDEVNTPNPMTKEEIALSQRLADKVIGQLFLSSPGLRHILKTNKNVKIYGIGNFLNKMIPSILNKKNMTTIKLADVNTEIEKLTFKSDYFIEMNYKSVYKTYIPEVVTDLILIASIMHNLNLNELNIIDIDNNDGILISDEYWDAELIKHKH